MKTILLRTLFFAVLGLLTSSARAQQVVQERLFGGSGYGKSIRAALRLSSTRYVLAGSADHSSQPGTVGMLIFTNANGDSLTSVYYDHYEQSAFFACVPTSEPSPYFLVSGFHTDTATQRLCGLLVKYDTLGNVIWERRETFPNSLGGSSYGGPVRVPDGYLFNSYEQLAAPTPNNFYGTFKLLKTDFAGNIQWSRTYGTEDDAAGPPIWLPDGSLLLAGTVSYRQASGRVRVCGKLWQLNPADGMPIRIDTLAMGAGEALLIGDINPLPNGGFLLTGVMRESLTQASFPVRVVRALDANWQTVWEKRFPPGGRRNDDPSGPSMALPLQNGETFWVGGHPTLPRSDYQVVMGVLAPPSGGTAVNRWSFTGPPPAFRESTFAYNIIPTTAGNALALGGFVNENTQQRTFYLANLTGLPAFYTPDYCTTPPPAPVVLTGPLTGGTLSFSVDSAATPAGPTYAYIPTVTWDFGDGSPAATGWSVRHTYASPQPVRVRACVTNSLFCTTCTDSYPLGVPVALPASALVVWPNPAADGRFRVRLTPEGGAVGAAEVRIYDALGREVARQALAAGEPETLLDLSAAPAGVYLLRLTLADGRTAVRRLVVVE